MEKHNKIAPPSTQSLEEAADTKAVDTSYIIERMKELDDTNLRVLCMLVDGLNSKNGLKVKNALDWYADKHGLTDSLVRFYVSFGIVPYVLEGCA